MSFHTRLSQIVCMWGIVALTCDRKCEGNFEIFHLTQVCRYVGVNRCFELRTRPKHEVHEVPAQPKTYVTYCIYVGTIDDLTYNRMCEGISILYLYGGGRNHRFNA